MLIKSRRTAACEYLNNPLMPNMRSLTSAAESTENVPRQPKHHVAPKCKQNDMPSGMHGSEASQERRAVALQSVRSRPLKKELVQTDEHKRKWGMYSHLQPWNPPKAAAREHARLGAHSGMSSAAGGIPKKRRWRLRLRLAVTATTTAPSAASARRGASPSRSVTLLPAGGAARALNHPPTLLSVYLTCLFTNSNGVGRNVCIKHAHRCGISACE